MGFNDVICLWKLLKKTLFEKKLGHGQFGHKPANWQQDSHMKAHLFKLGLVNSPNVTDINRHPEQPYMFLVTVKLWSH
jgi:hypothetical protein